MAPPVTRRDFIVGAAASAVLSGCGSQQAGRSRAPLPQPQDSGIDHIVVVMMENRSFDHFLGWVPGANGIQAGARYPDKQGQLIDTFHLSAHPEYGYQGCGKEDPSHNYRAGRVHLADGRLDGFLHTVGDANVSTDHFPVGYYTAEDLPFFRGVAERFTIFDNFYHGILSQTYPNRIYLHAGQTDRPDNTFERSSLPTIWDALADAGVSGRYYFQDIPVLALWWEQHLDISARFEQFVLDAATGNLPAVSIVDPRFLGEAPNGVTNDDHPQADIRNGQAFLDAIYNTLRHSPHWDRSLMVICYDEWGGFYDHVEPPFGPVTEQEAQFNDGRLGFRVPAAVLGPRVRRGHVEHGYMDVNSILNMICWRFGLPTLGARGEFSGNLATALDFDNPADTAAPDFGVSPGPHGVDCPTGLPQPFPNAPLADPIAGLHPSQLAHNAEWRELLALARRLDFDTA